MKVTFLGTGTSMGVPVAGGSWSDGVGRDPRNRRSRCSVWIETERASFLIDSSPEFRIQSLSASITSIDAVFITHEHMDHISGIDDIRPFNYRQRGPLPLYSNARTLDSIRKRFDYMFGQDRYPGSTDLLMREISSPIPVLGSMVTPLSYRHGALEILGFRVDDFSYLTDVKSIPGPTMDLIRGSRVLVLGGLRWGDAHPSHCTIEEAVEMARDSGVERVYLVHMNASVHHEEASARLPEFIRYAFDGQVIWI